MNFGKESGLLHSLFGVQVALPEGPTSYGEEAMVEATALANKMVSTYGLSPLGITIYAPSPGAGKGPGRQYEVAVESLDEDLFGKNPTVGSYPPSEQYIGRMRMAAQELIWEAYDADLVCPAYFLSLSSASVKSTLQHSCLPLQFVRRAIVLGNAGAYL